MAKVVASIAEPVAFAFERAVSICSIWRLSLSARTSLDAAFPYSAEAHPTSETLASSGERRK